MQQCYDNQFLFQNKRIFNFSLEICLFNINNKNNNKKDNNKEKNLSESHNLFANVVTCQIR